MGRFRGFSIASLALGAFSLQLSIFSALSFIGLASGIVGLVMANKALLLAPAYDERARMANTGRTLSIIGIVISAVVMSGFLFCTGCGWCASRIG